jgi:DnaJ like chaperone protein
LYAEGKAYKDRNGGALPATADRLLSMTYVYILLVLIYIFFPYDLLPDFLGGWGRLDDLVVLGLLLRYLFVQRKRSRGTQTTGTPGPDAEKTYAGGDQGHDSSRFDSNDPYTVLGVDRTASAETIKKAYRELVNKFHPDKVDHLGEEFKTLAEKRFKQIQQAYQSILQTRR